MSHAAQAKSLLARLAAPLRLPAEDAVMAGALAGLIHYTVYPSMIGKVMLGAVAAAGVVSLSSQFLASYGERARAKAVFNRRANPGIENAIEQARIAGPRAEAHDRFWLVYEDKDSRPRVMSAVEYEAYKRTAPNLTQLDLDGDAVVVTRMAFGKPDSAAAKAPAIERRDMEGTLVSRAWHLDGREVEEADVMRPDAAEAPEEPSAPGF